MQWIKLRRIGWGLMVAVLLFGWIAAFPALVQAADFRGGDRVVIGADQVINDDLFITAQDIVIDGTVNGDVYILASTLTINGTVQLDVNAGAQTIIVNGTVGDHLRVGAQNVLLGKKARVGHSALVGAYSLETRPGSTIGGDLIFGAFQGLLAGNVQHDVIAGANGIELRGTVGRNVRVSVGDSGDTASAPTFFMPTAGIPVPTVMSGLTIAPTAKIGGDLVYEAPNPVQLDTGAQVSGPIIQQTPVPTERTRVAPVTAAQRQQQVYDAWIGGLLDQLRRFLILLVIGLLALWLLPRWIQSLAKVIRTKPLGSFGRGLLMVVGFVVGLVAIVVVMILFAILFGVLTLGDLSALSIGTGIVALSVLAFAYFVFTAYVAPVVVSYLIGRAIFDRVQASWAQNRYLAYVVGLILLSLVALIPIVNWIAGVLVALFALGALLLWLAPRFSRPAIGQAVTP